MTGSQVRRARETRPETPEHLWHWVHTFTGVRIPREPVCAGHVAPFEFFSRQFLERPSLSLWHGPRGSGKSFLSAIDTHLTSRFHPRMGTRILGGSLAQSGQIYEAIHGGIVDGRGPEAYSDIASIRSLQKQTCRYRNGSEVAILAASSTSVRGPHVPCLKLDEVDEIEDDLRQQAMGIPMEKNGYRSSTLMTSTYHRVGGPMSRLIEQGRAGAFPVYTYCIFEVLERCPEERSGANLEKCPACPIQRWCHADRGEHPSGLPKAKRSNGHYRIEDLATKTTAVSERVFESDYLCLNPRAAGAWFTEFDHDVHVKMSAEFNRALPVHVSVDPGVETGGVWLQAQRDSQGRPCHVNVFGDHYAYDIGAEANALAVRRLTTELTGLDVRQCRYSMDSSAKQKTSIGPIVLGEYEQAGCVGRNGIEMWPVTLKTDELQLIEALLRSADRKVRLTIHPRCKHLIAAMRGYERAKRGPQWLDKPRDVQHPHEDLVDPLAGALKLEFPEGRTPPPNLRNLRASRVF
jgi:hypothetical protein